MKSLKLYLKNSNVKNLEDLLNGCPLSLLQVLTKATEGLTHMDYDDIKYLVKGAREIRMQQCFIDNVTSKYEYDQTNGIPKKILSNIKKDLKQMFDKAKIEAGTNAQKRFILIEGEVSFAVSVGICETLCVLDEKTEVLWSCYPYISRNSIIKVSIIDFYNKQMDKKTTI